MIMPAVFFLACLRSGYLRMRYFFGVGVGIGVAAGEGVIPAVGVSDGAAVGDGVGTYVQSGSMYS